MASSVCRAMWPENKEEEEDSPTMTTAWMKQYKILKNLEKKAKIDWLLLLAATVQYQDNKNQKSTKQKWKKVTN